LAGALPEDERKVAPCSPFGFGIRARTFEVACSVSVERRLFLATGGVASFRVEC